MATKASIPQRPPADDVAAIVVAAGSGVRYGSFKQFEPLAGRRVIDWSVAAARATCAQVVVVLPQGANPQPPVDADIVVAGGASRAESVRAGLAMLDDTIRIVAVHDGARPLATEALFQRVIDAVRAGADAVVPGVAVVDSLRLRGPGGGPVDRSEMIAVQTPQAFRVEVLRRAHATNGDATDDASLVDADGGKVVVVPGDVGNRKVTDPSDLVVADALLASRRAITRASTAAAEPARHDATDDESRSVGLG